MNTINNTNNKMDTNEYKTVLHEIKTKIAELGKKLAQTNDPVKSSVTLNLKDDDDCLFTKPVKPFEQQEYVPFPNYSLTFDESQIDIRNPNLVTQLDSLREKSIRVEYSRNFCGNA